MTVSANTIIAALKTVLEGVEGIGKVEDRWGGKVTWGERRRPAQNYWVITWAGYRERGAGIGPEAWLESAFRVRGWMPFSHQNPNTTPVWNDLVEAVLAALRRNRSIGGHLSLPQMPVSPDTVTPASDEETDETVCHHVVIEVTAKQHLSYTTE